MLHLARPWCLLLATLAFCACATAESVRIDARLPPGLPSTGTLITAWYTPDEVAAGVPSDPSRFFERLRRTRITRGAHAADGVLSFAVEVPARPATVQIVFDGVGRGLEALFGSAPGLATALVTVPTGAAPVEAKLIGRPMAVRPDRCTGERSVQVELVAPETRTAADPGLRKLCVYLPSSYAASPARRYPVVLAFPGFSGRHDAGDAWHHRALFDREGARLGVEVIVVGVGTRTPEGSSYLQRGGAFGDWDHYLLERVLPELSTRYRTSGRWAAIGHSTGGWNALALVTRHPERFSAAAASSPDAPDLDVWMLDDAGQLRQRWRDWIRVEAAMGGRGQMVSYAAAWSPDPTAPRGFAWPADPVTGDLRPEVYARWRAQSPAADLRTPEGLERARRLSGRIIVTAGRRDEFGLFEPARRYVAALEAAGVEARFLPTELGHFGAGDERFTPLVRFLLQRLEGAEPPPTE